MTKPSKKKSERGGAAPAHAAGKTAAAGKQRPSRAAVRGGWPPALWFVAAAILAFCVHAYLFRFTQDDAYISMRYAKNLVEGHGLVFNPGERVEGYTNFAWTLLLALVMKLGLPPEKTASILGVAFGAAAIAAAARLARALEGRWGFAAAATAALLAACPALALWCTGGLETGMFAFLVTAAFVAGLAPGRGPRASLLAAALFAAAALTRPEGALFFAIWFAIRVFDTVFAGPPRAAFAELARDALVFVVPMVVYAAWKLAYFGDLLPNTYYAKAGFTGEYIRRGLTYAKEFFLSYGAFGVAPALAVFAAWRAGARSVEARLLAAWIAFSLYVVWIGGDVLYSHRFWLPILPIGCVLVARGARLAGELAAQRMRGVSAPLAGAGLVVVLATLGIWRDAPKVESRRSLEQGFVANMTQTGTWLGQHMPPGSTIAITTIGAISYFSGLNVIDLLGLTDHEIAHNPKPIEGLGDNWREINYNAESVIARRPDAIMFSTGVRPSSAAEKALFLYKNFHETYFAYYFRSNPTRANSQTVFRVRADAPPVDLSLLTVKDYAFIDEYSGAHLTQTLKSDPAGAAPGFQKAWELSGETFLGAKEWWGASLYDSKDPRGAQILREVAEVNPYAVVAMIRLGDEALRSGNLAGAEEWFERVRRVDPDDSTPWAGQAEAARLARDYPRARELAREAVRLCDVNSANLVILGNLEAQAGELDTAKRCFLRALQADPSSASAKRGLYYLEEMRAGRTPPAEIAPAPGVGAP